MTAHHIWKLELDMTKINQMQSVSLPSESILLSVGEQDGQIVLWFQFPSSNRGTTESHKFIVAFTGGPILFPNEVLIVFKGTVQIKGFVFHVFSVGDHTQ